MKRNKRGFTIVELVIVIAVIAILAAVLIPTFTTLVDRAKRTADLQECKSAYTQMLTQEEYFGSKEAAKRAVFVGATTTLTSATTTAISSITAISSRC